VDRPITCRGVTFVDLGDACRAAAAIRALPDNRAFDGRVEATADGAVVWVPDGLLHAESGLIAWSR
jgi:hypothetical protein